MNRHRPHPSLARSSRGATRALAALVALATLGALGAPRPALACTRSVTCGPPPNPFRCEAGETAQPLFWKDGCVVIHLNEALTGGFGVEPLKQTLERSLATWSEPAVSYISLILGGLTNEDRVGYLSDGGNANVVMFRDGGWSHGAGILALTSVTYQLTDGLIVDADIELNDRDHDFSITDAPDEILIDLENTLTHELGHFLGFDHSQVPEATMFATAPIGETSKRTLHDDDLECLAQTYPVSEEVACAPSNVGYHERDGGAEDGACAQVGARRRPLSAPLGWLALALGAVVARRVGRAGLRAARARRARG